MAGRFAVKVLIPMMMTPFVATAQSTLPRGGIPAIAKAANGSIVSIVMSNKEGKPVSQGSGFFVSEDGLIVTNYHVISEGSSAVVKLPSGSFYQVDGVLTFDKVRDLAVIKAHGQNFRKLTLANSDRVQVGQEVVAIGNPLSLDATVSNGIVSGMRTLTEEGGKLLQITAPISSGSSGGPLFNMAGGVIGITTLYLKDGENLNFAIPINDAKPLLGVALSRLKSFPDEAKPDKQDENVPPSSATTSKMLDLEATVGYLDGIVGPEHRHVLEGAIQGGRLHSSNRRSLTIISRMFMVMAYTSGATYTKGFPEFTYSVIFEGDGKHEQKDYPRYMSFALGDINGSSIESREGGYDPYALAEFWKKHPNCEANVQCAREYLAFLDSAPKLTQVRIRTVGFQPLIERGGCSEAGVCSLSETTGEVLILFNNKDRADRFVTALTYAVKLAGQESSLPPSTHHLGTY